MNWATFNRYQSAKYGKLALKTSSLFYLMSNLVNVEHISSMIFYLQLAFIWSIFDAIRMRLLFKRQNTVHTYWTVNANG